MEPYSNISKLLCIWEVQSESILTWIACQFDPWVCHMQMLFKWNPVPSFEVAVYEVRARDLAHVSCEFSSILRWFEFRIPISGSVLSDLSGFTLVFGLISRFRGCGSLRFSCRSFNLVSLMANRSCFRACFCLGYLLWWRVGWSGKRRANGCLMHTPHLMNMKPNACKCYMCWISCPSIACSLTW